MRSHTFAFERLLRSIRSASATPDRGTTRRDLLKAAAPALLGAASLRGAARVNVDVGIVGAGLAGLACAHELSRAGIRAKLYEASTRPGGRCHSMGGQFTGPVDFPGQVVERGGELIDNLHKTMLGYAKEFRLTLEDVGKMPGDVFYHLDNTGVPEARVVEEFRAFVPAMRADLRRLSPAPNADNHTADDRQLDLTSLGEYLKTRGAGPVISKAIEQAYIAEYGRSIDEQSCLNFLLFIHADRRSKFTPFGVFSDERYHIVEGNEAIARNLASRLPGQIEYGRTLVSARQLASKRIRLTFAGGATVDHDAVVLTLPFSVLRHVDLSGLNLPPWNIEAINGLGYGNNAKMMIGFNGPYWRSQGSNGSSYSDLPNHQATWETNPTRATATRAVLADYSGAARAVALGSLPVQSAASAFLTSLERVFAGANRHVTRTGAGILAHLEHWPSNERTRGSYTCYRPGQFTTIAGNEGKRADNVLFAGEHTDSFYEWQGFMEGALRSGVRAAAEILGKA